MRTLLCLLGAGLSALFLLPTAVFAQAIPVAEVKHAEPVDFEKEILPIFRRSCLACHNQSDQEGKFVIETPASILKGGGEGPAVVPGQSGASLLLKLASHREEPVMPPLDNSARAKPLTSQELGLIQLWIDQGAKGEVRGTQGPLTWQPLPPGLNPIYSVALTADGQYAAAARANQVFLYHVPSRREAGRLTDPALLTRGVYQQPGVADLDVIQSMRFSPDGKLLATGGYRTVKLWERPAARKVRDLPALAAKPRSIAVSPDGAWFAVGEESGMIELFAASGEGPAKSFSGHTGPVLALAFSADGKQILSGSSDKSLRVWNVAEGNNTATMATAAEVQAVLFVPGGTTVASGHADHFVRLWNAPSTEPNASPATPLKEWKHDGPVTSLSVSADGARLLSGAGDGNLRVCDIASGNVSKTINAGGPVVASAADPGATRLVSVTSNNIARVLNVENGQVVHEFKGDYRTQLAVVREELALSLARRNVDSAKNDLTEGNKRKVSEEENLKKSREEVTKTDQEVKLKTEAAKKPLEDKAAAEKLLVEATTAKTAAEAAKKQADEAAQAAATQLPLAKTARDQAMQAATDAEKALQDASTLLTKAQAEAAAKPDDAALAAAVKTAEAAREAAAAKQRETVAARDAAMQRLAEQEAAKKQADEKQQQASKAETEAKNAVNQAEQKVKQLTPPAQKAADEQTTAQRNFAAAERSVVRAEESVQKATLAISEYEAAVKRAGDLLQQAEMQLKQTQTVAQQSEQPFTSLALAASQPWFVAATQNGMLHRRDLATGTPLESWSAAAEPISCVAITSAAIVAFSATGAGSLWQIPSDWQLVRTIGSPDDSSQLSDRVTALDFSPDGAFLATGSGEPSRSGEVKIWSVASGALTRALPDPHSDVVCAVEFSPDGRHLASCAADRFMKVFQVDSGALVRAYEGHTHHVTGVTWRADGRVLATSGADAVVKVWDALSGDQQRTIQGFNKEVTSLRFVADSDQVLLATGANLVRLVNAANGGNVRDFPGVQDYMYATAVSHDGKLLAAGGQDSIFRLWDASGQVVATFGPPPVPTGNTSAGQQP
jgi:WD40 repeat protein